MENKKVLVSIPAALLESVAAVAAAESRTRSDLVREALRRYIDEFKKKGGSGPLPIGGAR